LLVLAGAYTSRPQMAWDEAVGLLGVALLYNVFSYVSNDLIDLPVDRLQPRRQRDPLVRGAVSPSVGWAIALATIPISLVITMAAADPAVCVLALVVAYGGMAIYNVWGKRVSVPLVTDLIEGIAWSAMVAYGVGYVGGTPNVSTMSVFAFGALFIFLINGMHGGLRDLVNDLRCGKSTSAILLGAHPAGDDEVVSTKSIVVFSFVVHTTMIVVLATAVSDSWQRYDAVSLWLAQGLILGSALVGSWLLWRVVKPRNAHRDEPIGHHLFVMILTGVGVFALQMPASLGWTLVGAYLLPFLAMDDVAGRLRRRLSSTASVV